MPHSTTADDEGTRTGKVNGITGPPPVNGENTKTTTQTFAHESVHFDPSLKPKAYHLKGTAPHSKILFRNVRILDSTGRAPYPGDVYIEGERFAHVGHVPRVADVARAPGVRVIEGRGRTLMSGLGDAHTHLSWNNGDLGKLGELGVEEHTLLTAQAAKCYLDSGYTMCFGAASAKERLDCVIRDAINEGRIPGPRYLANGREMAVPVGVAPSPKACVKDAYFLTRDDWYRTATSSRASPPSPKEPSKCAKSSGTTPAWASTKSSCPCRASKSAPPTATRGTPATSPTTRRPPASTSSTTRRGPTTRAWPCWRPTSTGTSSCRASTGWSRRATRPPTSATR